ncbi:hypothetical protein UCDDS831_g00984 [Diplodia seriata]|uniref:Uncharacterized protein n=1 Tax=Diplodia seriata TaxID=420778 RepID=A0A0G2EXZ7_9PEZI|nr:hypothetical protein UCDDS831_g00984 [Diplodia seriata]
MAKRSTANRGAKRANKRTGNSASRSRRQPPTPSWTDGMSFDEIALEINVPLGPSRSGGGVAGRILDSVARYNAPRVIAPSALFASADSADDATHGTASGDADLVEERDSISVRRPTDQDQREGLDGTTLVEDMAAVDTHALNDATAESYDDGNHVIRTTTPDSNPEFERSARAQLRDLAGAGIAGDQDDSAAATADASAAEQTNTKSPAADETSAVPKPLSQTTSSTSSPYDPSLVPSKRYRGDPRLNGADEQWWVDFCLGVRRKPGDATSPAVPTTTPTSFSPNACKTAKAANRKNNKKKKDSTQTKGHETLILYTGYPEPMWVDVSWNQEELDIAYYFWTHPKQRPASYTYPRDFNRASFSRTPSAEWLHAWHEARAEAEEKFPQLFLYPELDGDSIKESVAAFLREKAAREAVKDDESAAAAAAAATEVAAPEQTSSPDITTNGATSSSTVTDAAQPAASHVPTRSSAGSKPKQVTRSQPTRQAKLKRKLPASESADGQDSGSGGPPAPKRRNLRSRK